jgi:peptidoglycan/xylan/chitin deacetylase (PgdA/CDA1 family)
MLREMLKFVAFNVLGSRALASRKVKAAKDADAVTILSLHRVAPFDGSTYPPLEPYLFETLLQYCTTHFEVVLFSELKERKRSDKPLLILSFDDGYKDFVEYACPIMEKYGIRANQNIIPACVETGLPPLNVMAQDFIGQAPAELVSRLQIPGLNPSVLKGGKAPIGQKVSAFLKKKPMAEQAVLKEMLMPQFERFDGFKATAMMSRNEVLDISRTHELGAHSFNHATMDRETDEFMAADAKACKRYFAEKLNRPVDIYAFPNGGYRPRQIEIVREAGFKTILLVGEQYSSVSNDIHQRFNFFASSEGELRFRATGRLQNPKQDRKAA